MSEEATSAHRRSKRPAAVLAGPYGHPFHATMVTIPIGAWVTGVVLDIVALAADDGDPYLLAGRWVFGVGVIGALAAAALGLMDYTRLARGTRARRTATIHMLLNIAAVILFAVVWALHFGDGPSVAALVLGIVGLLGVAASGFLGGEMVFRYGVRVADESDQAEAFAGR
jgi:uncharacterized membrane protein